MSEVDISGIAVQVLAVHRHQWQAGRSYRHLPARHPHPLLEYHLWLVREGFVEVRAQQRLWRIASGDAFFLPANLQRDITTPEPAAWLSIHLRITLFNRFNLLENLRLPVQWHPNDDERAKLESWMEHIARERFHNEPHHRLMVFGLGNALLGLCWPRLSAEPLDTSSHSELPEWLVRVLRRIAHEPACSIADLAYEAGFSPAQFRRSFHKWIGIAPREYLRNRRLDTARHLLETTDLSLRAVAAHIGLNNASHFAQVFKANYGFSPTDYRASLHTPHE
jgi:AraC-like DNA-binding protein